MSSKRYGAVSWSAQDLISLRPGLTQKEADAWLERNDKHIKGAMTSHGWTVLEALLSYDTAETTLKSGKPKNEPDRH